MKSDRIDLCCDRILVRSCDGPADERAHAATQLLSKIVLVPVVNKLEVFQQRTRTMGKIVYSATVAVEVLHENT